MKKFGHSQSCPLLAASSLIGDGRSSTQLRLPLTPRAAVHIFGVTEARV
jgi:hypothetical protein